MTKFDGTPVEEVHLRGAPLVKVLMQVQFSRTPQLVTDAAETIIAETLGRYPVRRRQVMAMPAITLNGQPMPLLQPGSASSLTYSEPKGAWQVLVTDTAVSLETTAYESRDDFCARALEVFRAVATVALPPVVDRVGLRYIDRLQGESLPRVPEFVIPQLAALHGSVDQSVFLQHSVTDSLMAIGTDEVLQVRTGLLPPAAGFDPALPPLAAASWVLDMDVYTTQAGFPFDPEELTSRLRKYGETAYSFFRWATTDAFHVEHVDEPEKVGEHSDS